MYEHDNLFSGELCNLIDDIKSNINAYFNEDIMIDPPGNIAKYQLIKNLNKLQNKKYESFYQFWVNIQLIINKMLDPHFSLQFKFENDYYREIISDIYYQLNHEIKEDDIPGKGIYIRTNRLFKNMKKSPISTEQM